MANFRYIVHAKSRHVSWHGVYRRVPCLVRTFDLLRLGWQNRCRNTNCDLYWSWPVGKSSRNSRDYRRVVWWPRSNIPVGAIVDLPIDPSQINHDNLPVVVGAMAVMVHDNYEATKDLDKKFTTTTGELGKQITCIQDKLDKYERCYSAIKFSFCSVLPWVRKHKFVVTGSVLVVSFWFSALDWITRWLQWTFLPPGTGP